MDFEIVGVFQSFSKDFDERAIRISIQSAHEVLGSSGVNTLVLSLKDTRDTDRVAAQLASMFSGSELESRTWVQLNDFYEKTIALYEQQFGFLQSIVLGDGAAERGEQREHERVRAHWRIRHDALPRQPGRHVFWLILSECAILGLVGASAGIALGVAGALIISAIGIPMPPPPNANLGYTALIRVIPEVLFTAFGIGFAATVIAARAARVRVSRTPIVDALRANI